MGKGPKILEIPYEVMDRLTSVCLLPLLDLETWTLPVWAHSAFCARELAGARVIISTKFKNSWTTTPFPPTEVVGLGDPNGNYSYMISFCHSDLLHWPSCGGMGMLFFITLPLTYSSPQPDRGNNLLIWSSFLLRSSHPFYPVAKAIFLPRQIFILKNANFWRKVAKAVQ